MLLRFSVRYLNCSEGVVCFVFYFITKPNLTLTFYVLSNNVFIHVYMNGIGCVMVSVPASSAVDRGFEQRSGQTKDYKIGICCFSAKYAALRRKSKDWLSRNQNNVSEWSNMSTGGLLFQ
jgi:hypothetical protein